MSPLSYTNQYIDSNLPVIDLTNDSSSNEKIDFAFTVRTAQGCYVKLELYNDQNKFETLRSEDFEYSTYFHVSVPSKTKHIEVYVGAIFADFWVIPFEGRKGLEVKDHSTVYSHDFHQYTRAEQTLISSSI